METMAQFPPTKEQLANIKKIEELQKTNKKGKNKGEIIKLLNANQKVNKDIDSTIESLLDSKKNYESDLKIILELEKQIDEKSNRKK